MVPNSYRPSWRVSPPQRENSLRTVWHVLPGLLQKEKKSFVPSADQDGPPGCHLLLPLKGPRYRRAEIISWAPLPLWRGDNRGPGCLPSSDAFGTSYAAPEETQAYNGLQPSLQEVSESDKGGNGTIPESYLGMWHHLHLDWRGRMLPPSCNGHVLTCRFRMGALSQSACRIYVTGTGTGHKPGRRRQSLRYNPPFRPGGYNMPAMPISTHWSLIIYVWAWPKITIRRTMR